MLPAVIILSGAAILCPGPVPGGRAGTWMLQARARLRPSTVDERYRLAERFYEAGDFEKVQRECQRILEVNPQHASCRALFTEISFILGQGKATPSAPVYDPDMTVMVRQEQLLIEIDHALARAEHHRVREEREAALNEARKVLEFVKWMPEGVETRSRRKKAELLKSLLTAP